MALEIVSVTAAPDDSVALTLPMNRRRPIVCCGKLVTMHVAVVAPLKTRMSVVAGVVRVGVQFVDVVQLELAVLFQVYVVCANADDASRPAIPRTKPRVTMNCALRERTAPANEREAGVGPPASPELGRAQRRIARFSASDSHWNRRHRAGGRTSSVRSHEPG